MDAIDFLERVGTDAGLFRGTRETLQDAQLADVLLASDAQALYRMLGRSMLIGLQTPAEEEDAPDGDEDQAEARLPAP